MVDYKFFDEEPVFVRLLLFGGLSEKQQFLMMRQFVKKTPPLGFVCMMNDERAEAAVFRKRWLPYFIAVISVLLMGLAVLVYTIVLIGNTEFSAFGFYEWRVLTAMVVCFMSLNMIAGFLAAKGRNVIAGFMLFALKNYYVFKV